MNDFLKWLGAEIHINPQKIVLKFQDKEQYDSICSNYECEGIEKTLTVRMPTSEFEALLQVYMGSITSWR